ncbi:hypothetical protein JCM1840_003422 [Sporobolomyces johnsonii]
MVSGLNNGIADAPAPYDHVDSLICLYRSLRPHYHLQWPAVFGSRASPLLWMRLMSAVGWIVRNRVGDVVPYPLFYTDDQFGVDLSGETAVVNCDGKECCANLFTSGGK